MAHETITETSVIQDKETDLQYQLYPKEKTSHTTKNQKISVYDQVRPQNEGKFLSAIREWEKRAGFETPIRWVDAIVISLFHILAVVVPTYLIIFAKYYPKWQTTVFSVLMGELAGFGVTGGAHRYWCHRSYKAKTPLQVILVLCFSMAGQNDIYQWVRDHRVHHKFSETSADPHNANRGFFFSHVGWLMMKKHPDVLREGSKIDMSDIINDPLVRFHRKYFAVFKVLFCFIIPIMIPMVFWGELWVIALFSQAIRYMLSLNFTWSVNSFAHLWGSKPYDRNIMPVENWGVSIVAMGEGWHNYHHTFPWDYKAAELAFPFNLTTTVLDKFASIGWAYDLKAASPSLINTVARNKGDPNCKRPHQH
ncbi:hypothetical protein ABMA28_002015 [Loxostege sticticalis]|uniref:Fatty acid desaturase domain-containing protein n=1 Tax=Loxostege sticticalis TaxID=481309 RepID=A0ABD0T3P9_LOXSC